MKAPTTCHEFDKAYAALFTIWGDFRIPSEVKELIDRITPARALELGCGVGRISRYMAGLGLEVTGVDFSALAIKKAKERVANDQVRPQFLVDDVRTMTSVTGPFDLSVDIGCFHCLDRDGQAHYVATLGRLLRERATHLMWVMDNAPGEQSMSPTDIAATFAPMFSLARVENRKRRLVSSHWYWLTRV